MSGRCCRSTRIQIVGAVIGGLCCNRFVYVLIAKREQLIAGSPSTGPDAFSVVMRRRLTHFLELPPLEQLRQDRYEIIFHCPGHAKVSTRKRGDDTPRSK